MSKKKFYILDGNNLLFRSYYALPLLANFDGEFSNGVYGFTNMLVHLIQEQKPDYIAVCFDKGKTFRHEEFVEYKAQRHPTPKELLDQFPIMERLLDAMGITHIGGFGLEADDIIGCLSKMFDTENVIVTADKDCLQLINDNTVVMQPKKGVTENVIIDTSKLNELMGVSPKQIVDLKALMGDSSDNIPGVKGIGEVSAVKLLKEHGSLDGIYANIDKITGKLKDKLVQDKDMAYLSYHLATIITDKELPYKLEDFEYTFPFNENVLEIFKHYQFNSLIKKQELFNANTQVIDKKLQHNDKTMHINNVGQIDEIVAKLLKCDTIYLHMSDKNVSVFDGTIPYVFNVKKDLISDGLDYEQLIKHMQPLFESDAKKVVFDSKTLKHTLHEFGVSLNNVAFDIMLGRYILNSVGKSNVTLEDVCNENNCNAQVDAENLYAIHLAYNDKLEKDGLHDVYFNIELPLTDVLFDMEIQGFKLDKAELIKQSKEYEQKIDNLTKEIYKQAGMEFNINSPKKLGEVLFDNLGLHAYNNKKKSTNAQVLADIASAHPIVPLIISYRTITKLYNTYIVPYIELTSGTTDRIHTIFNQFNTATGRLSSSEPNLQNIPVRTDDGKNIRKIFVPTDKDGFIVSADYSQIELRLLAAFSGDEKLINAFNNGVDIHTLTASEIFGCDIDSVTPQMRRSAKVINFGIVYGMSDYGLSQDIGISVAEANRYIKQYFARYPKIEEYMNSNVEFCKSNGYVTTLFGRRRYIPEINAPQYMSRQFGERAAKNMPLQGSASDIIKLAMVAVSNKLKESGLKSKLILQVHDELIVDTYKDELTQVCKILKDSMESVVKLKVNLAVNVAYGHSWYDAKD